MDDERISLLLGNAAYKAGLRLFLSGGIGGPEDMGDGLYKVRTEDGNLVIVGYEGGRLRYSCGCVGPHPCAHEAAAVISLYGSEPGTSGGLRADDPAVVGFIRGCIGNIARFAEDRLCDDDDDWDEDWDDDPDDDWDEDPDDGWGDDREGDGPGPQRTDELEEMLLGHVSRVCDDIADRVWDPDNTVSLVQELIDAVDGCESLMGAVYGRVRSFAPAVRGASAEALSGCYRTERVPWVDVFMPSVPEATLEGLLPLLEDAPLSNHPGVLMASGEYDGYVESRGRSESALLEVASALASMGRVREARRFADMLPRPSEHPSQRRRIASVYEAIGDRDTAVEYMLRPFLECPTEGSLRDLTTFSDRHSEGDLVSMVEDAAIADPSPERLSFLAEHGRADRVATILDGIAPERLAGMHSGRLFGALMATGHGTQAVRTARAFVVAGLEARDSRSYDRVADALLALDSAPPGMTVDGADAEGFKAGLRRVYGRLNKFWSTYRDEGGSYRRSHG